MSTLRKLASDHPDAQRTQWNNYNFVTRVKARSPESTFMLSQGTSSWITPIDLHLFAECASAQDRYLDQVGGFSVSGSIGNMDPACVNIEFLIESSHPNIAAMQQQLLFPIACKEASSLKVVYTPNFSYPVFPNGRGILLDLENYVTRIFGTDYFGESKKAGLRMWNKWIFDRGGLALHAGCKTYESADKTQHSMLIIGLSGTGKTTTTFTPHSNSQPIQDDFCALFPGGSLFASENGCFAKTYGLDPVHEPLIFKGIAHQDAWLENVYVDDTGAVDFFNDSHTQNGRGTFSLETIPHGNLNQIPPLAKILILNKDFNIIPAIARLNRSQAGAYFMLGETMGTSAGGDSEAGKALRVPGTNPFFPLDHALQGNRFIELLKSSPDVEVYLLNTGHIGQDDLHHGGQKITIDHSKKLIEAMLQDRLKWKLDSDFGYEIVEDSTSPIDTVLTNPRSYYEGKGIVDVYENILARVRRDRLNYLHQFKIIDEEIRHGI
jgi:phosphoenolpyruvate carboxykinase (ATP)